jgi:hypothetical protein
MANETKPTMMSVLRRLAVFADVADKRNNYSDEQVIAQWETMNGSKLIKAVITVGEARAVRDFLYRSDKANEEKQTTKSPQRKAAFGD